MKFSIGIAANIDGVLTMAYVLALCSMRSHSSKWHCEDRRTDYPLDFTGREVEAQGLNVTPRAGGHSQVEELGCEHKESDPGIYKT